MIDMTSEFGRRVDGRLRGEVVIWLTTVGEDFAPQPRPVWFTWDGESFLIYSQPDTWKVRHIAARPNVSLNLNSDAVGDDVVVFVGRAEIAKDVPAADHMPAYIEKYRERIADLDMSPSEFAGEYAVAIRIFPTKLRGA